MSLFRPTHLQIHLDRLMSNFERLRSLSSDHPFLCPMIKANAYGHGDVAVAKALLSRDCPFLGVACVEEGVRLRENHITSPILVFGFYGQEAAREIIAQKLTPVVSNSEQLAFLVEYVKSPTPIHLKFNTGMNRLGFKLSELQRVYEQINKNPMLEVQGVASHFWSGLGLCDGGSEAQKQLSVFKQIKKQSPHFIPYFHLYNSAAMVALYRHKSHFYFGSRPGLLAYGIDPDENYSVRPLVSPVMELKSKIVSTQEVKSGDVVSYGGTWVADKNSIIGIVPAGYADGVSRGLSNCGQVLVCGQRVPIRGRVCMDYTMVDLTEIKNSPLSFVGELVTFIGAQGDQEITVQEVARTAGRVNYEIMTGISERVPRLYGVPQSG